MKNYIYILIFKRFRNTFYHHKVFKSGVSILPKIDVLKVKMSVVMPQQKSLAKRVVLGNIPGAGCTELTKYLKFIRSTVYNIGATKC